MGRRPFGLRIGGHTSESFLSESHSKKLSKARAEAILKLVKSQLASKTTANGTLEAVGYGSTQRLPGFDDGGNYLENRRVDAMLLIGDGADLPLTHSTTGGAYAHTKVVPIS